MNYRLSRAATLLLTSVAFAAPALAQTGSAPRFVNVDANGVDLTTGLVSLTIRRRWDRLRRGRGPDAADLGAGSRLGR